MVSRTSRAYGLALCLFTAGAVAAAGCTGPNAGGGTGSGGAPASGGASGSGGAVGSGGANGSGGAGSGGAVGTGGAAVDAAKDVAGSGGTPGADLRPETKGGTGGTTAQGCDTPGLVWKTGAKTNYESYPAPGSDECIIYSGCDYLGQFAGCSTVRPKSWVMAHNIVSVFPDFGNLKLHDLCLKSGNKTIVVTVIDECADTDCAGCCTQNKGSADELIDIETFTDARFGVGDGRIQWADLGPTKGSGCN